MAPLPPPIRQKKTLISSYHQVTHVRTICSYCDLPGSLITSAIKPVGPDGLGHLSPFSGQHLHFMGIKQAHPPQIAGLIKGQWWLRIQQNRGGWHWGGWELGPLDSHATHAPSCVVCQETHTNPWENMNLQASLVHGGSHLQKNLAGKANSVVLRGTGNSPDFSTQISQPQMTESHLFLEPEPLPEHEPSNGCGIETIGTWTFHQKQANPTFNMFKVASPVTEKNLQLERCGICETECNNSEHLIKQANKKMKKKWHTHHFAKRCQT